MPSKIIKGTEKDFEQFGRKRFIAVICQPGDNIHFAVRSLDLDKKQHIIHCNGGAGRFMDSYNKSIREYLGTIEVLAERKFY